MIRRVYSRDPVYSLLLTFGLAFIIQDVCRYVWGPNGLPLTVPASLSQPLSSRPVLHHRLPRLHGGHRRDRRWPGCSPSCATPGSACASAPARSTSIPSPRSASTCGLLRSFNFAARHLSGRSRRRAGRRPDRPQSEHGRRPADAELHRHHRRRRRQPDRHLARRPADRRRLGADHRVLPRRQRGGDLRHHGTGAAGPAARI